MKIITLAEGEIGALHVGLKGTMNALYLTNLRQKVWRGLEGRVRQGRSGYNVIRELDACGDPVCGGRVIDEAEAVVMRRIFAAFATGKSPRAIARELNAECIPGPGGRAWSDTTIRGHALRCTGILHNELYIGRLVWNKQRYVKDPTTGKRLARINPEGVKMDNPKNPDEVASRLEEMHTAGKGVIGMKVFGEGAFKEPERRDASLRYVLGLGTVNAFIIGLESTAQVDDLLTRTAAALADLGKRNT